MLRKVLLVAMAIVVGNVLLVMGGYTMYRFSPRMSEASLSLMARFVFSPLVAALTGALVGVLSKDRPIPTAAVGVALVFLNLLSPEKPTWSAINFEFVALGAIAALFGFRLCHGSESTEGVNTVLQANTTGTESLQ